MSTTHACHRPPQTRPPLVRYPGGTAVRIALCAPLLVGCSPHSESPCGPAPKTPGAAVHLTATVSEAAAQQDPNTVAWVAGRTLRADDVVRHAAATGLGKTQALDDLIQRELLFQEAIRRGLDVRADVRDEVRRAMIRRLLSQEFEAVTTPDSIPERSLRAAFERGKYHFVHDELVRTRHLLLSFDAPKPKSRRGQVPTGPAPGEEWRWQLAEKFLGELRAALPVNPTREQWAQLASTPLPEGLEPPAGSGLATGAPTQSTAKLTWEDLSPFPRQGSSIVEPFSAAAHGLKRPGDVSPPVRTQFGVHLIYLVERIPARHSSYAQALPELRTKLYPGYRRAEFLRFMERMQRSHRIVRNDAPLTQPPDPAAAP